MPHASELNTQRRIPRRRDAVIFRSKTALLQLRRAVLDLVDQSIRRHSRGNGLLDQSVVGVSVTPLWTEADPAERSLIAGKLENLRRAAAKLDGLEVSAGTTFSFWKHVGRTSRFKGYVPGRELREGCIIPSIGGGLCQLSNALYDAALQAGFKIVERHRHTQIIPGSLAESGRDATVFWNYVDLRFRADSAFRIEVRLDTEALTVQFRGERGSVLSDASEAADNTPSSVLNSCATCGVGECHRAVPGDYEQIGFGSSAFLVDEYSPEIDDYVRATRTEKDVLYLPLDGKRFRKQNYSWTTDGFATVNQSLLVTAKRSYRSRSLSAQGAARQQNLLRMYEELAASYAKRLRFDALHLVIHQNLLPFLWRSGCLGGRTFDVLMTSLPIKEIQKILDRASDLHPESKTLGDFRADGRFLEAEMEALRHAAKHHYAPYNDRLDVSASGEAVEMGYAEACTNYAATGLETEYRFPCFDSWSKGLL